LTELLAGGSPALQSFDLEPRLRRRGAAPPSRSKLTRPWRHRGRPGLRGIGSTMH